MRWSSGRRMVLKYLIKRATLVSMFTAQAGLNFTEMFSDFQGCLKLLEAEHCYPNISAFCWFLRQCTGKRFCFGFRSFIVE